jgi:coenzyme F420-0:L-glutamate ligase/coenzyme F420-1:gamma-L-glutamate ligase
MMSEGGVQLIAVPGLPEIAPGDDLAGLILKAAAVAAGGVRVGDVAVIAQKIVSKAEGRRVALDSVTPSARALELASVCGKDARLVELVLGEAAEVVRCVPGVLIVRHRLGFIVANAAIDQSNVEGGDGHALLLPVDPDGSAAAISDALSVAADGPVGVVINDSFGRPWRRGTCGVAIGCARVESLADLRGRPDRFGRMLRSTEVAVADEIAAAASLVMGQSDEGLPVVLVRGLAAFSRATPASALLRTEKENLFR